MPRSFVIAIDGPVASGKTTAGKRLATRLQYRFLDTGIMYRAVTWLALYVKIDPNNSKALADMVSYIAISLADSSDDNIIINEHELSFELRSPDIDRSVSLIAQIPEVRVAMVKQQRHMVQDGNFVVVGRDIGTVVLPNAALKLYLTASTNSRADRRHKELLDKGIQISYEDVLRDLEVRDNLDMDRTISPLRPALDAIIIDTNKMNMDQVVDNMMKAVTEI